MAFGEAMIKRNFRPGEGGKRFRAENAEAADPSGFRCHGKRDKALPHEERERPLESRLQEYEVS